MGRKPLPPHQRHSHITWLRLDADLRAWVEAKAARERLAVSDVLRQIVARAMEAEQAGREIGPGSGVSTPNRIGSTPGRIGVNRPARKRTSKDGNEGRA